MLGIGGTTCKQAITTPELSNIRPVSEIPAEHNTPNPLIVNTLSKVPIFDNWDVYDSRVASQLSGENGQVSWRLPSAPTAACRHIGGLTEQSLGEIASGFCRSKESLGDRIIWGSR